MACQTAFGTTELLEGILLLLPLPDLLRVQAVSKRWQDVITTSTPLQEKLFYKAVKSDTVWLVDVTNLPGGLKPLPRRYLTGVRVRASVPRNSVEMKSHYGLSVIPVQISPLCVIQKDSDDVDYKANTGTTLGLHRKFLETEPNESSSWRNMLLTQPPVQYITIEGGPVNTWATRDPVTHRVLPRRNRVPTVIRKIFIEGGVRVQDVISELEKATEPSFMSHHQIYLHGAIAVSDEDWKLVDERTKEWRDSLASLEE